MAGLDPAIHEARALEKTWMPGTSPGMTTRKQRANSFGSDFAAERYFFSIGGATFSAGAGGSAGLAPS